MNTLLWAGAAMAAVGLAGLLWCMRRAAWIRRAELSDDAVAGELRRLLALNIVVFGVGFAGLAVLVVGLILA